MALGLRGFERRDRPAMLAVALDAATSTDRGEVIAGAMTRRLREVRIALPAASTLERVALVARAQARRQAFGGLIRDLTPDQAQGLEDLLSAASVSGRTAMTWTREWPEAPSAANLKSVLERLEQIRRIGVEPDRGRRIHLARYRVIAAEAAIMSAQHLSRLERRRRLATLCAFALEMEVILTDAAVAMVEKMVGSLFRRAERTRSERLMDDVKLLKKTARVRARLGRALIEARAGGGDALSLVG